MHKTVDRHFDEIADLLEDLPRPAMRFVQQFEGTLKAKLVELEELLRRFK